MSSNSVYDSRSLVVSREMLADILMLIARLRALPASWAPDVPDEDGRGAP
jgi:hypothetical protein